MPDERKLIMRPNTAIDPEIRSRLPQPKIFDRGGADVIDVGLNERVFTLAESLTAIGAPMVSLRRYFRESDWMPHLRTGHGNPIMVTTREILLLGFGITLVRGGIAARSVGWYLAQPDSWTLLVHVLFDRNEPSICIAHDGGNVDQINAKMTLHRPQPHAPVGEVFKLMGQGSLARQFTMFDLRDVVARLERATSSEIVRRRTS
jgi:hypothetical protein